MTHFRDMSPYVYFDQEGGADSRNIGWLSGEYPFPTRPPTEDLLEKLWSLCSWHVLLSRGIHHCDFCTSKGVSQAVHSTRNGTTLLFGNAEIRAFARDGTIFAAPNMIYHYVEAHHYAPPDEFLRALDEGPMPPSAEYFEKLAQVDPRWSKAPMYDPVARRTYTTRRYLP